jgi:hypothetical protein
MPSYVVFCTASLIKASASIVSFAYIDEGQWNAKAIDHWKCLPIRMSREPIIAFDDSTLATTTEAPARRNVSIKHVASISYVIPRNRSIDHTITIHTNTIALSDGGIIIIMDQYLSAISDRY